MSRAMIGDLDLGNARIGTKIKCIQVPNISFWQDVAARQSFVLPNIGGLYVISSVVRIPDIFNPPIKIGVRLSEIQNPSVTHMGDNRGEPFFSFGCFIVQSSRP